MRSIPQQNKWHPSTDKLVGNDVYGKPFSNTPWSVKFSDSNYDQYMFTTGDYTKWMVTSKDSIIGWYSNGYRSVLKSSTNATPYVARWYRRTPHNPEDPWLSLGNYNSDVIYGANAYPGNYNLPGTKGGAKVFIRDSTGNTDLECLGPSTLKANKGCQWTPAAQTTVQSKCECRDSSFILDRLGQKSL